MTERTIKWDDIEYSADEILDYETFIKLNRRGTPVYNNFTQFFVPDIIGDLYRSKPVFQRFQQDYPELLEQVMGTVAEHWPKYNLDVVNPILHEAYKIMKSYTIDGKPVLNYPDLFA